MSCPDTYTPSYMSHATREAEAVAQRAEHLKISKYAHFDSSHHFIPVAVETSGVFGPEALSFHDFHPLPQSASQAGHRGAKVTGSRLLGSREMRLLFLGQWEGQLDWKLLLAECTLHYLFVCLYVLFLFLFLSFFNFFLYCQLNCTFGSFVFFFLYCNYNYKLGLSTI